MLAMIAAALVQGAPAASAEAAATPAAAAAPEKALVKKKDKVVCETVRVTGSWQGQRVCRTVEEKTRHAEAARRRHENMSDRRTPGRDNLPPNVQAPRPY